MARINNDNQEEINNITDKITNILTQQWTPYFAIEINDEERQFETQEDMNDIMEEVEKIMDNKDQWLEECGYTKDEMDEVETIRIYYYYEADGEPDLVHTIYEKEE